MLKEVVIHFDYDLFWNIVKVCTDNKMDISEFVNICCGYTLNEIFCIPIDKS